MSGKNRLVPIVLGITKQSVVRMDEKTKEVIIIFAWRGMFVFKEDVMSS